MCALAVDSVKSGAVAPASPGTPGKPLPSRAQVVVVGAGVVGSSVAYHLTRMGCRDVLLLERKAIGCGTTWHSHGVVGLTRASPTLLRMAMETARLLPELERQTGKSTGYSARGSINVTADPSRMIQFRRFADTANAHGLPVEIIDPAEAKRLWPHLNTEGLIGAMSLPTEGQCNPLDLTQAFVAGARSGGARVVEGVAVSGAEIRDRRIVAIETEAGRVECETLVNCTGLWGRDFLRAETGGLPLQAIEHNYLVTEFSEDITQGLPLMRDPDNVVTVREDAGQLSVGFNEHVGKLFAETGVPDSFAFDELPPDWDAIAPYWEGVAKRAPILNDLGIRLFLCGPEAASPDTRYMLGPLPPFENYFVASGFTGVGVGSSGGVGAEIARWVIDGQPGDDLWEVDIRRMMPFQSNRTYLMRRTVESNGKLFAMNWPYRQNRAARGVRRSPLHTAMAAAGACFFEVGGWEVPEWFAPQGVAPEPSYSFDKPAWFPRARSEAQAARSGVALADRSMTGKFLVMGKGAGSALAGLLANDPAKAVTAPILAPLLNADGGVEALFTVIAERDDRFLLIGEPASQHRDHTLLGHHLASARDVHIVDMTAAFALVDVIGPHAGDVLSAAGPGVERGYDPAAEIGMAIARIWPQTGLGVPAWSVLVASEFAISVFEALMDAGKGHGVRPIGLHAYQALRTMAGTPVWSQGLTPTRSAVEAGLDALVDLSDGRAFPGRDPCARQMRDGVLARLCRIRFDGPDAVLLGHEPVRSGGKRIGAIDQAAYPLVSDRAVGLAYLSTGGPIASDAAFSGRCDVCVCGDWIGAEFDSPGDVDWRRDDLKAG